jgi:drug/metabolite transporter (DMT)-like permease
LCTAPERGTAQLSSRLLQTLPLLVFVTFGCYFSIFKYLQTHYLDASSYHAYVVWGFVFAFATAIVIGSAKGVIRRAEFRLRHVVAGLFLGMVNYLAAYTLLRVLALQGWESSQIYPIYSVGVVAVSAVLAVLLFKERLSRQKTFGLAVGMLAVVLLNQ